MKTPEEMAEKYAADWHKDSDYPPEILQHTLKATETTFLAGYQAAKDEYKEAIDTYNDVAKQMMEEAVRIMSPKDQVADADKVICNTPLKEILAVDTGELMPVTNLPTPAKWISVKERLPEDDRHVVVRVRDGEYQVAWEENGHWFMENPCCTYESQLKDVTHWMPLPEAPKGEG